MGVSEGTRAIWRELVSDKDRVEKIFKELGDRETKALKDVFVREIQPEELFIPKIDRKTGQQVRHYNGKVKGMTAISARLFFYAAFRRMRELAGSMK